MNTRPKLEDFLRKHVAHLMSSDAQARTVLQFCPEMIDAVIDGTSLETKEVNHGRQG
jgi:hypothetical protein